jgi:hypothetical protein
VEIERQRGRDGGSRSPRASAAPWAAAARTLATLIVGYSAPGDQVRRGQRQGQPERGRVHRHAEWAGRPAQAGIRQELRPVLQDGAEVMDRLLGNVNGGLVSDLRRASEMSSGSRPAAWCMGNQFSLPSARPSRTSSRARRRSGAREPPSTIPARRDGDYPAWSATRPASAGCRRRRCGPGRGSPRLPPASGAG